MDCGIKEQFLYPQAVRRRRGNRVDSFGDFVDDLIASFRAFATGQVGEVVRVFGSIECCYLRVTVKFRI